MTLLNDEMLDGIYLVERACFDNAWTMPMLSEELNNPLSVFVTENRNRRIVGFALGRVVADEGEVYRIGVLPEYRRLGIAKELLGRLLEGMSERGAGVCFLEVRSRNTSAISLYERSGFRRISVRRGYYGDDDAVIMTRTL